jgi:hypothetical protein
MRRVGAKGKSRAEFKRLRDSGLSADGVFRRSDNQNRFETVAPFVAAHVTSP